MSKVISINRLVACALLVAAGCIEIDPQPSPGKDATSAGSGGATGGAQAPAAGDTSGDLVFVSAPVDGTDDVVVAGSPGAVAAGAQVRVHDDQRNADTSFDAADDGSFGGVVQAGEGDTLKLLALAAGKAEAALATKSVPKRGETNTATPGGGSAGMDAGSATGAFGPEQFTVSAPDAQGVVVVSGSGLGPSERVVATNPAQKRATDGFADAHGAAALRLVGKSGDTVYAFELETAVAGVAGKTFALTIPSP